MAALAAGALACPALASAHIERAGYWPDPAPDPDVHPAAGGKVPDARSLRSALDESQPGETRVVCHAGSLERALSSIHEAETNGLRLRPTLSRREISAERADRLREVNRRLFDRCAYHQIQPAVSDSRNDDRVVIMPGVYPERSSRAAPTHDPSCKPYRITNDRGDTEALSYEYHYRCRNDQNLIAVMGRKLGPGADPAPRDDRHGIPNLGACLRCNLQLEGSVPDPADVVIDAGRVASGDGAPIGARKDVGIRADRADGFVLRNVTVRHATEHGIYMVETDGYLLNRVRSFYNGEYGALLFVSDHGRIENCEAAGNGDSGLYPGGAPETGDQTIEAERRYNQRITRCDSHHNALGYSGTDGNAVRIDHTNFYDNALGISTDVFTAAGHPGYPEDSALWDHNRIFSNNFNVYAKTSDVTPTVPIPVGTGMWIAGGNHNIFRDNHVWDNWRRGAMLFSVPDAFVCTPPAQQTGCDPASNSTSYNNEFYDNVMGIAPDGSRAPNGLDFWWDQFPGNTGNCWHDNGEITSEPPPLLLPKSCGSPLSVGTGNLLHEAELVGCLAAIVQGGYDPTLCPWFETPPRPGSPGAVAAKREERASDRRLLSDPAIREQLCELYGAAPGDFAVCD